jgi:hypothetical protein
MTTAAACVNALACAVVVAPEAAWRVRAREALQPLLDGSSNGDHGSAAGAAFPVAPLHRRALDALDAVLHRAQRGGLRAVSVGALRRYIMSKASHDDHDEGAARGAPAQRLSAAAHAPPQHDADAACERAVSAAVRALQAAGWSSKVSGWAVSDATRLHLRLPPDGNARAKAALLHRAAEMRRLVAELHSRAACASEAGFCRVLVTLPDGNLAHIVLPTSASLLDVYAAVAAHLHNNTPADDAVAVDLAPFDWSASRGPVDAGEYLLTRHEPLHSFTLGELRSVTLSAVLPAAGDAAAASPGRNVLHLSVKRVGAGLRTLVVSPMCIKRAHILRTSTAAYGGAAPLASPIVHLRNVDGEHGATLCSMLRLLLPPGFDGPFYGREQQILPLPRDDQVVQQAALNAQLVRTNTIHHPSTGALQEYGHAILRGIADALRAHHAAAAADVVAAALSRPYIQILAVGYAPHATLIDHVDMDGYLVLISLGCVVEFRVDGQTVPLESGDALFFVGGNAHNVVHGIQRVRRGTCPPGLPAELADARLSLMLRKA